MRTFKVVFIFVMVVLTANALVSVQAQQPVGPSPVGLFPDSPTYAVHGSHWVGTREFVIPDKDGKRPLPATIWYPALNGDLEPEKVNYTYTPLLARPVTMAGKAIADAFPDFTGAPFPLVIFAHSDYSTRFAIMYLIEHLASHGFVVVAAQRTGTGTGDTVYYSPQDMENVADSLIYGPADIQRQIDFATALTAPDGALSGLIDTKHIALIGQADGVDKALAAAGARIGLGPMRKWCNSVANDPNVNSGFNYYMLCKIYVASEERLLAMRKATTKPGEVWSAFDVKGVGAVVSLALWTSVYEGGDLSGMTVPALVITDDYTTDPQQNGIVYEGVSSQQKAMAVFGHAVGAFTLEPCDSLQRQQSYFICFQEQVWDLNRAHDRIRHITTAFLLDVLKGDKDAHKALLPDAVKFPSIDYKTTMK